MTRKIPINGEKLCLVLSLLMIGALPAALRGQTSSEYSLLESVEKVKEIAGGKSGAEKFKAAQTAALLNSFDSEAKERHFADEWRDAYAKDPEDIRNHLKECSVCKRAVHALVEGPAPLRRGPTPVQARILKERAERILYNKYGHWDNDRSTDEIAEAKSLIARALDEAPWYGSAHNDLANIYSYENDWERAKRHYKMALQTDPKQPVYYTNIGHMYMNLAKTDLAAVEFRAAIEIRPTLASALRCLADTYDKPKSKVSRSEAIALYKKALKYEIDPSVIRRIKEALKRIQARGGDVERLQAEELPEDRDAEKAKGEGASTTREEEEK